MDHDFWISSKFLADQAAWEAWGVLVGGLLITAMLLTYLISVTNYGAKSRRFALELTTVNEGLKAEVRERKQAEEALRLRTQESEALFKIASALVQPGEFEEKATRVLGEVAQVAGADWVTFRQVDQGQQGLQLLAAAGPMSLKSPLMLLSSDKETLAFDAIRQGKTIVANDYAAHPNASPDIVALGMNAMVLMPVKVGGQSLGLMNVVSRKTNHFTPELVKLLLAIADGMGVLLENAGLKEQVDASVEEMALVDQVSRILGSTLNIADVYQRFFEEVRKLVEFEQSGIVIFSDDRSEMTTIYQSEIPNSTIRQGESYPLEGTISALVLETRDAVVLDNLDEHPEFWTSAYRLKEGLHSTIVAPLISGEKIYGTFSLSSRQTNGFANRERVIVERLAAQIAPAVKNAQLYQELQASTQEMDVVDEIARIITSTLDITQIYERFAREVTNLVDFDRINISTIDLDADTLTNRYLYGTEVPGWEPEGSKPLRGTPAEHIAVVGETAIRPDIAANPEFPIDKAQIAAGLRSGIRVPLITKGQVSGLLNLFSSRLDAYGPREQRILERLANQIAPAVENSRLYEDSNRLAQAFESIGDAVSVVDQSGILLFVNKRWEVMFGYSSDDVLGKPFFIIVPPDPEIQAQTRTEFQQNFGRRWIGEIRRARNGGEEFDVSLTRSPVNNQNGEVIGSVAVYQDITERKQTEEALRLRTQELEALFNIASILVQPGKFEEKAARALDEVARVAGADWVTFRQLDEDRQGLRLVAAAGPENQVTAPIPLLLPSESLSFTSMRQGETIVANDYAILPNALPHLVALGMNSILLMPVKASGESLGLVNVISRNTNHFTPDLVNLLSAIADGMGVLLENARLQEEITLSQELEQRRDAFVSIASHELRTPMTTILGFSELLLNRNPPEATRREWIERIHLSCGRLVGIVDNLLNVSRIQSGKLAVKLEQLPLSDVIEQVVEETRSTTENHEFLLEIPPDTPKVVADRDKLAAVLTNLLTNAVKYSPSGGQITVSTRLEAGKDRVVVAVADQGIGISRRDRENLFTTFHRIHRPETHGISGTGLGLYIVKELVELMHGEVWLKSHLGKGSTFSFSMPTKWYESGSSGDCFQ